MTNNSRKKQSAVSLSSHLKKLIDQHNLTPTKLWRLTGVPQPVIHQMTSGKNGNPKLETLRPLCTYFKISMSQLIGEVALPNKSDHPYSIYNWQNVPIIRWEDAVDWPATKQDYLDDPSTQYFFANRKVGDCSYALVLDNRTMEPLLLKGTHLIADPDRQPKDGNFVVAHFAGKQTAFLKQITRDSTGQQSIRSSAIKLSDKQTMLPTCQVSLLAVVIQSQLNF